MCDEEHLIQPVISIVYHSAKQCTKRVAELLAAAIPAGDIQVCLLSTEEAIAGIERLHSSNTIVFGCMASFGTVSAGFKKFMEATAGFWYQQTWKDKLAAGFTCSSTVSGDKLNALDTLFHFAAQHSMQWISLGILPRFCGGWQTDGQNRLASYIGLMVQAEEGLAENHELPDGDLLTIELFGRRLRDVTMTYFKPGAAGNALKPV